VTTLAIFWHWLSLPTVKSLNIIIGGDWNLTPSPLAADVNPDVKDMVRIPNEKHTRLLQKLQLKFSLVDAFRILHPTKTDFSYSPWNNRAANRSRIDFVLISSNLVVYLSESYILPNVQCSLFDHKATFTSFTVFLLSVSAKLIQFLIKQ
jgi:exonuclease III